MFAASVAIVVAFALAALAALRAGRGALARTAGLVALTQGIVAGWSAAAPLAVAAWLICGLSLPEGTLGSHPRRVLAAAMAVGGLAWTIQPTRTPAEIAGAAGGAALMISAAVALRCVRAAAAPRRILQWVAAAAVAAVATDAVLLACHLLFTIPATLLPWLLATMVAVPVGLFLGQLPATARLAEQALAEAVVVAGLTLLVVAVYLVVVAGLARSPTGAERDVLFASVVAALTAVVLALPLRTRLMAFARSLLGKRGQTPQEMLATFGARMTRAVPFDELLLQLVESLRATLGPAGAEAWVGDDGVLRRVVSVPIRPDASLTLDDRERLVVSRTRIGGNAWTAIWLAGLVDDHPAQAPIRVAPVAHLGHLLGLLVVRRPPQSMEFSDADDRVLIDLARQLGLALHNMRLDSALQASLEELRRRNEELKESRLRIVTAADAARRKIERDLHDGAQQHLVALSIKIGLVREVLKEDPATAGTLLDELRVDVQQANAAFRELAHGIYPPLLRDHGLGEALRSTVRRVALPYQVDAALPRRFPEEIEAAVYFCCAEAIQNAGKHAGPDAAIEVRVAADDNRLCFEVSDNGRGFAPGAEKGHGFVNMADRLGAVGGALTVHSTPGAGTVVRGEIPLRATA